MDFFGSLLEELGSLLNIPLSPDKKRLCKLNINNALYVQIEEDSSKERILMASFLCDVPPGKYRENLFRECLKANALYPRVGTFSYSERNNKLALFEYIPLEKLQAEKLADNLAQFAEKAISWKLAVEKGAPLPTTETYLNTTRSFLFELT